MLTPEQKRRVEFIANDLYVDEESSDDEIQRRLTAALREVETAEELHHLAACFNWDTGIGYLWDILRHPMCDAGTALMLYWLASPDYWYRSPSRWPESQAQNDPPETLTFLLEIENRYLHRRFATDQIRVDPRDLDGDDAVGYYERHLREDDRYRVPELMKQPSPGSSDRLPSG